MMLNEQEPEVEQIEMNEQNRAQTPVPEQVEAHIENRIQEPDFGRIEPPVELTPEQSIYEEIQQHFENQQQPIPDRPELHMNGPASPARSIGSNAGAELPTGLAGSELKRSFTFDAMLFFVLDILFLICPVAFLMLAFYAMYLNGKLVESFPSGLDAIEAAKYASIHIIICLILSVGCYDLSCALCGGGWKGDGEYCSLDPGARRKFVFA